MSDQKCQIDMFKMFFRPEKEIIQSTNGPRHGLKAIKVTIDVHGACYFDSHSIFSFPNRQQSSKTTFLFSRLLPQMYVLNGTNVLSFDKKVLPFDKFCNGIELNAMHLHAVFKLKTVSEFEV